VLSPTRDLRDSVALPRAVQVVVAGGGLAGSCAAAALAQRGYHVLIVEPGVTYAKRLAGELLHPPALADLRALGLAGALTDASAQPVDGFAVFLGGDGGADARCVLAYDPDGGRGATVEHGALVTTLLERARSLPNVSVITGARVDGVVHLPDAVTVTIAVGGARHEVRAELLVAADGRSSNVRKLAGIPAERTQLSAMAGFLVETDAIPCPDHGHIFASGAAPVLAYGIAPGKVRVMIDVDGDVATRVREPHRLAALPEPFRAAVARTVATQRPLIASNLTVVPSALAAGRVVLVGDAAGCCHPVSASGLASAAHDARVLAESVAANPDDISRGLARYARGRQRSQSVRIALASALYRAFAEVSPEMTLLRRGLVDYWQHSPRGRAASMALLATQEQRFSILAREYAHVAARGLPTLFDSSRPRLPRRRAVRGLLASVVPHVAGAVQAWLPQRARVATHEAAT
jgi:2-polyprenyl-6-methoxyphenol hydroxylase-like FAD-dependent oxidoreductase